MDDEDQEPNNWTEINRRIAQPRPSLSPSRFSESAFKAFRKANREPLTEDSVMSKIFPVIAGTADIPSERNLLFGNLEDLTDGSITKAKPDHFDGSRPTDLNKQLREELAPYIVPSTNTAAPCLPNFFTEAKGRSGNTEVCKRQALYDGALGARGIHELRSYIDSETAYDDNAYTITSIYHGGGANAALSVYVVHPMLYNDARKRTEYRLTQLNGWDMTGNSKAFREGASALRNARDWAKEKREELMMAANSKASDVGISDLVSSTQSFVSLSSNKDLQRESETSADDVALDATKFNSSNDRSPARAQMDLPPKISPNQQPKKAAQVKKRPHGS